MARGRGKCQTTGTSSWGLYGSTHNQDAKAKNIDRKRSRDNFAEQQSTQRWAHKVKPGRRKKSDLGSRNSSLIA